MVRAREQSKSASPAHAILDLGFIDTFERTGPKSELRKRNKTFTREMDEEGARLFAKVGKADKKTIGEYQKLFPTLTQPQIFGHNIVFKKIALEMKDNEHVTASNDKKRKREPEEESPKERKQQKLVINGYVVYQAASAGDLEKLKSCLASHESLRTPAEVLEWCCPEQGGMTPLIAASMNGQHECVAALLEAGANINFMTQWGVTALIQACSMGQPKCVTLLLAQGADPNLCGSGGFTPLMCACSEGQQECINALLDWKPTSASGRDVMLLDFCRRDLTGRLAVEIFVESIETTHEETRRLVRSESEQHIIQLLTTRHKEQTGGVVGAEANKKLAKVNENAGGKEDEEEEEEEEEEEGNFSEENAAALRRFDSRKR